MTKIGRPLLNERLHKIFIFTNIDPYTSGRWYTVHGILVKFLFFSVFVILSQLVALSFFLYFLVFSLPYNQENYSDGNARA